MKIDPERRISSIWWGGNPARLLPIARHAFIQPILLILSTICSSVNAATWYVDLSNTGSEDGTTWATAFTTIQPAIDAAFLDGGGDVWVAQGTYNEIRISPYHISSVDTGSLVMQSGVNLFGGFLGNETLLSQRDVATNVTTVDGSTARSGLPAFHVLIGAANATIDGFTVQGGIAATPIETFDARLGGGFFSDLGPSTIRNVVFTSNSTPSGFGAAVSSSQDLIIDSCRFVSNTTRGGRYLDQETVRFRIVYFPRIRP